MYEPMTYFTNDKNWPFTSVLSIANCLSSTQAPSTPLSTRPPAGVSLDRYLRAPSQGSATPLAQQIVSSPVGPEDRTHALPARHPHAHAGIKVPRSART